MKDKRDAAIMKPSLWKMNDGAWRTCRTNFTGMAVLWIKHKLSPQSHGTEQLVHGGGVLFWKAKASLGGGALVGEVYDGAGRLIA